MITTPTVFVLGAGASAPYGFPLGSDLVRLICEGLRDKSTTTSNLVRQALPGVSGKVLQQFTDDLAAAGRGSIDAFLQIRQDYLEIGKACIAAVLLPFERERELELYPASDASVPSHTEHERKQRARRWYHYLFDQMLTGGMFEDNKLSVITFNFDRSFERALYRVLRAHSGNYVYLRQLCASIPIVHVHGSLGSPAWLDDSDGGRQYDGTNLSGEVVSACASQIQLVFDDATDDTLMRARTMLRDASRVCYLGFSYHPLNLGKLDFLNLADGKTVAGTTFGMPQGQREAVQNRFEGRMTLAVRDWDILTFLEETRYVHE